LINLKEKKIKNKKKKIKKKSDNYVLAPATLALGCAGWVGCASCVAVLLAASGA
jgi:hypothetical protein